jgi:PAS domain-containing protein
MSRAVVKIRQANLTLKESQEKLQAQNELLNRVMESLTHPFYVVDVDDYSIGMANSAAYRNGVYTGHTCYETVHQYSAPCSEIGEFCPIEEVKKTKTPMVFEHVNYDTNGNPRNIEIHVYPIFGNQGNIIQLIEYCIDITERRQTEKSLESERPDKTTPHLLKRRNSYKENRANIRFYKRICNVCTERFQHQS